MRRRSACRLTRGMRRRKGEAVPSTAPGCRRRRQFLQLATACHRCGFSEARLARLGSEAMSRFSGCGFALALLIAIPGVVQAAPKAEKSVEQLYAECHKR